VADPVVNTNPATEVTDTAGTLEGECVDFGGHSSLDWYFKYGYSNSLGSETDKNTADGPLYFSMNFSGLTAGTTIYYQAAVTDGSSVWTGDILQFTTGSASFSVTYDANGADSGTVPTDSTDYASGDTVTVLGNTGGLDKTDDTFSGWNTQADGSGTTYNEGDTFTIDSDVTLYAIWPNSDGPTPPTVTTEPATNVVETEGTMEGSLDDLGGYSSLDWFFEYGSTTELANESGKQSTSNPINFSMTLQGLSDGDVIYYRAAVTDGSSVWTGDTLQFLANPTTLDILVPLSQIRVENLSWKINYVPLSQIRVESSTPGIEGEKVIDVPLSQIHVENFSWYINRVPLSQIRIEYLSWQIIDVPLSQIHVESSTHNVQWREIIEVPLSQIRVENLSWKINYVPLSQIRVESSTPGIEGESVIIIVPVARIKAVSEIITLDLAFNTPVSKIKIQEKQVYFEDASIAIPLEQIRIVPDKRGITVIPLSVPSIYLHSEVQQLSQEMNYSIPQQIVNIDFLSVHTDTTILLPLALVQLSAPHPFPYWTTDPSRVQSIYLLTLTGSADGEEDIIIPISSCQIRRRDGKPTYLSVVVPKYDDYVDAITNRSNGELVLKKGVRFLDGGTQIEEITRVYLEDIRLDKGPRSRSITLSGHKTISNDSPNEVNINKVTYKNTSASGLRRFRSAVDLWVRPGDTVVLDGEAIVAGMISYTIQTNSEVMEIEEAEG